MQCIGFNGVYIVTLDLHSISTAMSNDCRFYYCPLLTDLLFIYTSSGLCLFMVRELLNDYALSFVQKLFK